MQIEIDNLTKRYGSTTAVDGISFVAEEGELTSLVGPSGCGKTTTLRCVAGLERPNEGHISIGGETVTDPGQDVFVPPHQREIGFVFQTFDVWPHLTVFENVAYPLHNRDVPEAEIEERVMDALELTGIDDLREKPATQLSGGQQARVGICRSIVYEPRVLLFDEPLTGLDRNLRKKMRYEIKRIQSELGITSIYVTHSQPEAMTLSDKICLMNTSGKIEQMGTSREIYNEPQTQFTFDFFGTSEEITGVATDGGVETDLGTIRSRRADGIRQSSEVTVGFRPQDVEITQGPPDNGTGENEWAGTVRDITFLGVSYEVQVDVNGTVVRSSMSSIPESLEAGQEVTVHVDPDRVFVYERGA